jgi:hypothetical protein
MRSGGLAALEWLLGEAPHGYIRGLLQTLAHLFMRGERCLWDTSCPFVVLIASQDVASRIVIAIEFGPTIGARVPAHCEVFGYQLAIATALLAGVLWGDSHDFAASLFRFAATEQHELAPTGIQHAFV